MKLIRKIVLLSLLGAASLSSLFHILVIGSNQSVTSPHPEQVQASWDGLKF